MTPGRWRGARQATITLRAVAGSLFALTPIHLEAVPAGPKPEPPSPLVIRWIPVPPDTNQVAVQVTGLSEAALQALRRTNWTTGQWQRLLAVHAEQGDLFADIGLPAMLGAYQVDATSILFQPRFPLMPGITYRASFHPDQWPVGRALSPGLSSEFKLPPRRTGPGTVVSGVQPSADLLPENLLKFYIHFSEPMSGGHIYDHIQLRDETGRAVELPFLEIDEELWNPAMTRLTLFIDPGRIKRGVRPLEEIGPALEQGKRYTLSIDREWKDAAGMPLMESFTKVFRVGPPAREPLDPNQWRISAPAAGARAALVITFPAPMDHALAQRLIRVARATGGMVEGTAVLEDQERRWAFTPAQPWSVGPYHLLAQTTLEDLAGNNIGKSFEVDLLEPVQRRMTNSVVKLGFEVK